MAKIKCLNCATKFKGDIETTCPNCGWSIWYFSKENDDPRYFIESEKTLNGFWMAYKIAGVVLILVVLFVLGIKLFESKAGDFKGFPISSGEVQVSAGGLYEYR